MKSVGVLGRVAVATAGAVLLVGVAGAAFADDEYNEDDVEVNVEIEMTDEPGTLSMTVASDSTSLAETGDDGDHAHVHGCVADGDGDR